jgi:hypothetical protein
MKKILLLIALFSASCGMRPLYAQTTVIQRPDCQLPLGLITAISAGASAGPIDNRVSGCTFWALVYTSNGFSALSLIVQTAPDAGGTPGAWSTYAAASGANPNTTTTQNSSTFGTSYFPWLRVQLTSKTGTGSISGNLYGWRYPPPASISAIIGLVTVIGNKSNNTVVPGSTNLGVLPCIANAAAPTWTETFQVGCSVDLAGNNRTAIVTGQAADGAAVSGNPVRVGGKDGSGNTQDILTDTSGVLVTTRVTAGGDGNNNASGGLLINTAGNVNWLQTWPQLFNGGTTTGWDRQRSASLANQPPSTTLTARNSIGAALTEKGSRWTVIHNPAAGTQAVASIASEASVRHVVDCISFSGSAGGAVTAANVNVNLRDGATGAGTIIWTYQLSAPTAAALGIQSISPFSFCGLNLVGTTATAMTLEFSAGVANLSEAVSMSGYNVN